MLEVWEGNGMYSGSVKQKPSMEHLLLSSIGKTKCQVVYPNQRTTIRVIQLGLVEHSKLCCKKTNDNSPVPAKHRKRQFLPCGASNSKHPLEK